MSSILDALKKVEERLRSVSEQSTADGLVSSLDLSAIRDDLPKPSTLPEGESVAMEEYLGLLDMIARVRKRVREVVEEERASARETVERLNQEIATLQSNLAQQKELHAAELETGKRALVHAYARIRELQQILAESNAAVVEVRSALVQALDRTMELSTTADAIHDGTP